MQPVLLFHMPCWCFLSKFTNTLNFVNCQINIICMNTIFFDFLWILLLFFQINTVFNQFKIFPSNYFPLWTYGKLFPLSDIFINSSSYKQNNTENWKRMRKNHAVQCSMCITTAKWIWCIKIVHSWNGWNTNRHGCICDDRIERN